MTAVNQILPFATGTGANVLTPAQYQALAALGPGFTSGILPSANLNTILRQASFVASMIGQFIVDKGGVSALDDGNIAELEANFAASITAFMMGHLGALATLNIGAGLFNDGNGNLAALDQGSTSLYQLGLLL
jgi:hypothetical protein